MNNVNTEDKYYQEVIKAGDEASGSFKEACKEANQHTLANRLWILESDGSISVAKTKAVSVKVDIDGVGTKVQIYTNQFENIFQARDKKEMSWEDAKEQATELWYRMLMDLIAMNADDLRNGQTPIALTNIIDINHLKGPRGHLFQDSMSEAFRRAITKTGIAMTAGETAVLGESPKTIKLQNIIKETIHQLRGITQNMYEGASENRANEIDQILNAVEWKVAVIMEGISFNIGGTVLGLKREDEKLTKLEDHPEWDIIAFQEQSANGIIWPRSNGITKIREDMQLVMWEWREDKSFEDFIAVIDERKIQKIPQQVQDICKGKKMRDIATGTTTVFSPFVSNILTESEGESISKIIHVTGNPLKKIAEWIDNTEYVVDISLRKIIVPQVITLLQVALDIPDDKAMNKRNMWVPYAILVHPNRSHIVQEKAKKHWFASKNIGTAVKRTNPDEKHRIANVGLNSSQISF